MEEKLIQMKRLISSILKLGAGETIAKLAGFAFYGYISRAFDVELLGIVALSQTVAGYVTMGTDLGLRMIGARRECGVNDNPFSSPETADLMRRMCGIGFCIRVVGARAGWCEVVRSRLRPGRNSIRILIGLAGLGSGPLRVARRLACRRKRFVRSRRYCRYAHDRRRTAADHDRECREHSFRRAASVDSLALALETTTRRTGAEERGN